MNDRCVFCGEPIGNEAAQPMWEASCPPSRQQYLHDRCSPWLQPLSPAEYAAEVGRFA